MYLRLSFPQTRGYLDDEICEIGHVESNEGQGDAIHISVMPSGEIGERKRSGIHLIHVVLAMRVHGLHRAFENRALSGLCILDFGLCDDRLHGIGGLSYFLIRSKLNVICRLDEMISLTIPHPD